MGILGGNFFEKKFPPNPFQKTLYWETILRKVQICREDDYGGTLGYCG
jgi:hypothetical protein